MPITWYFTLSFQGGLEMDILVSEFEVCLDEAELPENLIIFRNLVVQFKRYCNKYSKSRKLGSITAAICHLLLMQVYVQTICPFPNGEDRFFTDRFGELIAVLFAHHPDFVSEVTDFWIESRAYAETLFGPQTSTVH
jgi:hypothetical protein